jgi:hypothetical protein
LPEIDGYENWWLLGQVATLREVINWPVNWLIEQILEQCYEHKTSLAGEQVSQSQLSTSTLVCQHLKVSKLSHPLGWNASGQTLESAKRKYVSDISCYRVQYSGKSDKFSTHCNLKSNLQSNWTHGIVLPPELIDWVTWFWSCTRTKVVHSKHMYLTSTV